MGEGKTWLQKLLHPALILPLAAVLIIIVALLWYPPLFQPGYAPVDEAPFFTQAGAGININSAGLAELTALRGIGESRAAAIIEYREAHGPFATIDEIMEVRGIGPGIFEDIKDLITTG